MSITVISRLLWKRKIYIKEEIMKHLLNDMLLLIIDDYWQSLVVSNSWIIKILLSMHLTISFEASKGLNLQSAFQFYVNLSYNRCVCFFAVCITNLSYKALSTSPFPFSLSSYFDSRKKLHHSPVEKFENASNDFVLCQNSNTWCN